MLGGYREQGHYFADEVRKESTVGGRVVRGVYLLYRESLLASNRSMTTFNLNIAMCNSALPSGSCLSPLTLESPNPLLPPFSSHLR